MRSPPSVLLRCKVCVDRTQHLQRFEGKSDFPRNEFVYDILLRCIGNESFPSLLCYDEYMVFSSFHKNIS